MPNHVIPLSTLVHLQGIADYTKDWRKDDWDKLLAITRGSTAELGGHDTVAEEEAQDSLSSLADHASPQDGGHRGRVDRACEVALNNACRKYRSYAKEHYHYQQGRGGTDYAVKNINPQDPRWSELGLDDLAEVCSEAFTFLRDDGELGFFEASITLSGYELQLKFSLNFEQFEFALVCGRALELPDDIGHYPTDQPEDTGC